MFWDLLNIDQALPEKTRYESLAAPLPDCRPYEEVENEDGMTTRVWHLQWKEAVDKGVDPRFIREISDRIMTNKQVSTCHVT